MDRLLLFCGSRLRRSLINVLSYSQVSIMMPYSFTKLERPLTLFFASVFGFCLNGCFAGFRSAAELLF